MQIKDLLLQATQQLTKHSESARLDAELLLAHCLDKPRSYLFTWPEATLTPQQLNCFNTLFQQRLTGRPVAHLLGYREFWDLNLEVTADTLIPRPDTELLVETALELLADQPEAQILELGTGSGAIAIALAKELPSAQIVASDISAAALQVAAGNARRYRSDNISFLHSNWFSALPAGQRFDLILSNPPYIAADDPHLQSGDVRFEPLSALASGADGLDDIRYLIRHADCFLKPGAALMFEHGYDQGQQTVQLMQTAGYHHVRCLKDLAGHDRITLGHVPPDEYPLRDY